MSETTKNKLTSPEEFPCATCQLRAKAEARPQGFSARLWRWHTKICPGWKAYQRALSANQ